ncbi:hypothetical protein C8D88_116122 [Lentzea atacamensis]|uniref:Uncharacterized protein n=1 Tax=Lentzea atacamensis TaxID=531938 RepID=A0A316HNF6_9PSEU|nr:hypothetical protein C8D88_116122 [Lentzea atacamensis]
MSFDPHQYARQTLIRHAHQYAQQGGNDPQARELAAAFRQVGRELAASLEQVRSADA